MTVSRAIRAVVANNSLNRVNYFHLFSFILALVLYIYTDYVYYLFVVCNKAGLKKGLRDMTNLNVKTEQPEKYRFERGHLFELENGSYIHCYQRAGLKNKAQAIKEYESCNQTS